MAAALNIAVRPERAGDEDAIRDVNQRAFGGPLEARIVDAVRRACLAEAQGRRRAKAGSISLVAILDGAVIGHILFTPVAIDPPPGTIRVAGLAPMAVDPQFQRMGVGATLIRAGLDECRRLGYSAVVVVGHPAYYPRFGFVPAHTRGMRYADDVPAEAFMVLELQPGTLPARGGVVRYRPEFVEE